MAEADLPEQVFLDLSGVAESDRSEVVRLLESAFAVKLSWSGSPTEKDLLENKIELLEEDIECVHMFLDDEGAPREDEGGTFSLVGRIKSLFDSKHKAGILWAAVHVGQRAASQEEWQCCDTRPNCSQQDVNDGQAEVLREMEKQLTAAALGRPADNSQKGCEKCDGTGWVESSDYFRNKRCKCNP